MQSDGVRQHGEKNNSRGRGCRPNTRANNCKDRHRERSGGHEQLPSRRSSNGSSRLSSSFSELGTGPVATRSFYCCTSALLSDCWHSRAHLHSHRDARRCLDRDLWVQGSTIAGSLCNLVSIFGQLYPATLLARLVTLELADRGVHEAVHGTFETFRCSRAMSVFRRNPEDICSHSVFLS